MDATVVELRYQMKDVLRALDRNESVRILYHGKVKGTIVPNINKKRRMSAKDHPLFGSLRSKVSVVSTMDKLRAGRYDAL